MEILKYKFVLQNMTLYFRIVSVACIFIIVSVRVVTILENVSFCLIIKMSYLIFQYVNIHQDLSILKYS
jgi:hypothetical protein